MLHSPLHQEPSHGRFVLRRRFGARERHPPRPRRPQMMPRTFALAVPQHAITRSIIKSQTRIRRLAAWREPAAPKPRPRGRARPKSNLASGTAPSTRHHIKQGAIATAASFRVCYSFECRARCRYNKNSAFGVFPSPTSKCNPVLLVLRLFPAATVSRCGCAFCVLACYCSHSSRCRIPHRILGEYKRGSGNSRTLSPLRIQLTRAPAQTVG